MKSFLQNYCDLYDNEKQMFLDIKASSKEIEGDTYVKYTDVADIVSTNIVEHRHIQCFHCGEDSVIWDNDFNFEDFGLEGDGLVHVCHCPKCGSEIVYYVK